jgi:murein DD-endopeptidase MepM/ murein hydrolase activator NlpD
MSCFRLCFLFVGSLACYGVTIRQSAISLTADEQSCAAGAPAAVFKPGDRQAFLRFVARQVNAGDRLTVEWIDPQGKIALATPYPELPASPAFCFLTQMPIAGFEAASQPGRWTVRVTVNQAAVLIQHFDIARDPNAGRLHISIVSQRPLGKNRMELTLDGGGFDAGTAVYVAQYTELGGWKYLSTDRPSGVRANRIVLDHQLLPPGEYMIIVRNSDGALSQPSRLLMVTQTGYKLPFAAGVPWQLSQGPYGGFSHFNRTLHAWDIAPYSNRCVVAMRGGIAHTFDLGMGQNLRTHTFGNYITIEHDNGEFSHYAHLQTGSFRVKNGQRVEQGQALAIAGTSGYSFGTHVHVQVTRALAIHSPSIPFRFEDMKGKAGRGSIVSANESPLCDCSGSAPPRSSKQWSAKVAVSQWWSDLLEIKPGVEALDIKLSWPAKEANLDLHLMSPSGKHYGWYGITNGYSGSSVNPESFHVPAPEAGIWRVSVQGIQGAGEIEFTVEAAYLPSASFTSTPSRISSLGLTTNRSPPLNP